jgi:hypothetical protein
MSSGSPGDEQPFAFGVAATDMLLAARDAPGADHHETASIHPIG